MPDNAVVQSLQAFRVQMDMLDQNLMEILGRRWMQVERNLQSEVDALTEEMLRRQAEGETITLEMVYKSERYEQLRAEMEAEIAKFNRDAEEIIIENQKRAAALGIESAQMAINNSLASPLSMAWNRINVGAVEAMMGLAGDGTPLYTLLAKDFGVGVDGLLDALISGIAMGKGSKQIALEMFDGMGMGLDRAMLIARTETQRAYRMGATEQYRQSGVTTGFMRLVKKDGACLGCLLMDGEVFATTDELDDHPNGRCTAIPIVRGVDPPTWEKGKDWLLNQPESRQREIMGNERFELWKAGVPLESMADKVHDEVWGDSPRPAPIYTLREADRRSRDD